AAPTPGPGPPPVGEGGGADMPGLPFDNIDIRLADSSLPQTPVEGGSWMATSVAHGIATTAEDIRKELLRVARKMKESPLAGAKLKDVVLADGTLAVKDAPGRAVSIADIMRHGKRDRIAREKTNSFKENTKYARNTHSAIFAEVKVDEQLGIIRVTRVVNAVAAGRIV